MLFEPNTTPYDVRFRIFGIPVRIHPLFWLFSVILGFPRNAGSLTIPFLLIWVACVFVSVLLHEMGHVVAGRLFGADGSIVLYSFGGLAIGSNDVPRRWQRVIVSLAGPFAQLVLAAALYFGLKYVTLPDLGWTGNRLLGRAIVSLLAINFFWPLLNLLPIWPLDGGQVTREVLGGMLPGRGLQLSLGISMVVAGLLAVNALMVEYDRPLLRVWFLEDLGGIFLVMLFASLAIGSWQALQSLQYQRSYHQDRYDEN